MKKIKCFLMTKFLFFKIINQVFFGCYYFYVLLLKLITLILLRTNVLAYRIFVIFVAKAHSNAKMPKILWSFKTWYIGEMNVTTLKNIPIFLKYVLKWSISALLKSGKILKQNKTKIISEEVVCNVDYWNEISWPADQNWGQWFPTGVPWAVTTIPWSLFLFHRLGMLPYVFNT